MSADNHIIELLVDNFPGVMVQIIGVFFRRNFSLKGIYYKSAREGGKKQIYLLVKRDDRMEQVIKQITKLYDVKKVSVHERSNGKRVKL